MVKSDLNFIVLLYVSRSGSTYLARLLAEKCEDLAVIPETNYFRILTAHQKVHKKYQPEKLAHLIMEDPKFKGFHISQSETLEILQNSNTHKAAIIAITKRILFGLGMEDVKNVIIKDGGLLDYLPEITAQFENTKVIHIQRDARACINSLLHTPKAFHPGKSSMGWNDIELCTKQYARYIKKINTITISSDNFLALNYENLVDNVPQTLKKTIAFLGLKLSGEDKSRTKNYLRKEERPIHSNIYRHSQRNRKNAWQQELKKWEIVYIEKKLKTFLPKTTEYSIYGLGVSYTKARAKHVVGMAHLTHYRIKRYLFKPNLSLFYLKLKLRLAS